MGVLKDKNSDSTKNDSERKGLKKSKLLSVPEIKQNPITLVLIKKYMVRNRVDTDALLKALFQFSNTKDLELKLKFLFSIYDMDGDGYISSTEFFELLKILNNGVLENWKLQNIVDKTFAEIEEYTTQMNYTEFRHIILKRSKNLNSLFDCD